MTESFVIPIFHCFHKNLLSLFVQKAFVEFLVEMTGAKSMFIENLDYSIHDNRCEEFGYVKTQ